ncbi:unnamed protein product [Urochloa humidicola]
MAPTTRRMRARAASGDRIPPDALFEALLRLPARDVCRLRGVCRSWRDLIADPVFVAAHAEAHRGPPLFLAKFMDDKTSVYIVDLSGAIIKRVARGGGGPYQQLLPTCLNVACVAGDQSRCGVLNPATGALQSLPRTAAQESAFRVSVIRSPSTFFTLGRVPATGEHKVIRMFNGTDFHSHHSQQVFEVLTVSNGGEGHGDAHRWRGLQGPGLFIEECSGTVVDGVVYFMTNSLYDGRRCGIRGDYIVSFDLGREEWGKDIRGPISSNVVGQFMLHLDRNQLALVELSGYLVLAELNPQPFTMDLWYLLDSGSGLWVKQYRIPTRSLIVRFPDGEDSMKPLLVLDDGRLVLYVEGRMFICDLENKRFKPICMKRLDSVALYTGNLLSLE